MQYGHKKNADFDADFESVEKIAQNLVRKKLSMKNLPKNGVFLLFLLTFVGL
jgi:hypothetical protein